MTETELEKLKMLRIFWNQAFYLLEDSETVWECLGQKQPDMRTLVDRSHANIWSVVILASSEIL